MLEHYAILTENLTSECMRDMYTYDIEYEMHLARTRLWLDPSVKQHDLFYIKYSDILRSVLTTSSYE
jgi:hypothetical protein